jgi:hypothetical protein
MYGTRVRVSRNSDTNLHLRHVGSHRLLPHQDGPLALHKDCGSNSDESASSRNPNRPRAPIPGDSSPSESSESSTDSHLSRRHIPHRRQLRSKHPLRTQAPSRLWIERYSDRAASEILKYYNDRRSWGGDDDAVAISTALREYLSVIKILRASPTDGLICTMFVFKGHAKTQFDLCVQPRLDSQDISTVPGVFHAVHEALSTPAD